MELLLKTQTITIKGREDKLIQAASKDGAYKVREGYRMITNSQQWEVSTLPLNLCWDPASLPKVGTFLWTAMQKKILTKDRIRKWDLKGHLCVPFVKRKKKMQNTSYSHANSLRNAGDGFKGNSTGPPRQQVIGKVI